MIQFNFFGGNVLLKGELHIDAKRKSRFEKKSVYNTYLLHLVHTSLDFNQTWAVEATWNALHVHEVESHIPRSKVI